MGISLSRVSMRRLFLRAIIAGPLALAAPANALCARAEEEDLWVNTDPDTPGIVGIRLRSVCKDHIVNGVAYPPGPSWYVHIWGKCHPTHCDWNEVGAWRSSKTGVIYAAYDHGFAKRQVMAILSRDPPDHLRVLVWTDFTDPARPDYSAHYLFRRANRAPGG